MKTTNEISIVESNDDSKVQTAKEKRQAYYKEYYAKDKENRKLYNAAYHKAHKEERCNYTKNYYKNNKERCKIRDKEYHKKTKKIRNAQSKVYRLKHKEELNKRNREYYKANKANIIKQKNEAQKKKRAENPDYKFICNLRSNMCRVVRQLSLGKKPTSTFKWVGCSAEKLKIHFESLFVKGMTWNNYGEWHIDHIRPVSSFKPEEWEQINHYTNLQPLWAEDNLKKSDNYSLQ